MQRVGEEGLLIRVFDDLAEIHDRDAVADVLYDGEIVRDKQIREVLFALQIHHQIDDLSLDRHVERRDRLVADDQLRVQGERPGDADALPLAAGKLVRKAAHLQPTQPDLVEEGGDALLLVPAVGDAVDLQRLADDIAGRHARVQG